MSEDADPAGAQDVTASGTDEVEAYETDDGVVFYDAGNPLAWIESHAPVRLDDAA